MLLSGDEAGLAQAHSILHMVVSSKEVCVGGDDQEAANGQEGRDADSSHTQKQAATGIQDGSAISTLSIVCLSSAKQV
jgi:hypothetical protein